MGDARKARRLQRKTKTARKHRQQLAFGWSDRGRQLTVMNQITTTNTGLPGSSKVQATPACIIATGQTKPLKVCTSGWRRTGDNGSMLDGERWTGLVRSFAATVGFHLYRSVRDTPNNPQRVPENDGRFVACHAEKKLGLFFLAKQMKFLKVSLQDALEGKLREAKLPLSRRQATVYLGHKPCKNCIDFLRYIRRRTGIDVRTESGPVFFKHKRERTFYENANAEASKTTRPIVQNNFDGDSSSDGDGEDRCGSKRKGDDDDDDDDDNVKMDDANDSLDTIDGILEEFPVNNVVRRRSPVPKVNGQNNNEEENNIDKRDANKGNDDLPLLLRPLFSSHMSVRSSPSPSISLASVLDSSVIDRRERYPVYTSPTRRGGNAPPPSVWGERSKPPVTPSFEAPDFQRVADDPSSQIANEQSYFFGTPSVPSEVSVVAAPPAGTVSSRQPVILARPVVYGTPDSPIVLDEALSTVQSAISPSIRVERARVERRNRQTQPAQPAQQPPIRSRLEILSDAAHSHRTAIARNATTRQPSHATTQQGKGSGPGPGPGSNTGSPLVDLTADIDLTIEDDDSESDGTPNHKRATAGSAGYASTLPTPASQPRRPSQRVRKAGPPYRRGIARPIRRSGQGRTSSQATRPFPDLSEFVYDNDSGWV